MSRTNYSAYMGIKRQLLHMFTTQKFERNKLPPESKLAQQMGISLVTLREALLMLALEGYITKRHGSGNYIHPSALNYENRSLYFADCLKNDGYDTTIKVLRQSRIPANEEIAKALHIQPGDELLRNEILYLANKKPAIITHGHIPVALIEEPNVEDMRFEHVHVLIQRYLHRELAHSLNEYVPYGLPDDIADVFGLPAGTPIIGSKQVFFDVQDVPVLYNEHFFYPNLYRVKTLQNWDLGT